MASQTEPKTGSPRRQSPSLKQLSIMPALLKRQDSDSVDLSEADRLKQLESNFRAIVSPTNKVWAGKMYPFCFVGSVAVRGLVQSHVAPSVPEAVKMGRTLGDHGLLDHVTGDHVFDNNNNFYRFYSSCKRRHPSAAFMGWMAKKGKNRVTFLQDEFQNRFCVLTPPNIFSYFEKFEKKEPNGTFYLSRDSLVSELTRKNPKQGKPRWQFSVTPEKNNRTFVFRVRSRQLGEIWLQNLTEMIESIPVDFVDSQSATLVSLVKDIKNQLHHLKWRSENEEEAIDKAHLRERKVIIEEEIVKLKRALDKLKIQIEASGRKSNLLEDFANDFNSDQPPNVAQGIVGGVTGFLGGVGKGITGVFTKPVEGAQKNGLKGFSTGVAKGVAGVVGHSFGGLFQLVGGVVKGASNTIKQLDREVLRSGDVSFYYHPGQNIKIECPSHGLTIGARNLQTVEKDLERKRSFKFRQDEIFQLHYSRQKIFDSRITQNCVLLTDKRLIEFSEGELKLDVLRKNISRPVDFQCFMDQLHFLVEEGSSSSDKAVNIPSVCVAAFFKRLLTADADSNKVPARPPSMNSKPAPKPTARDERKSGDGVTIFKSDAFSKSLAAIDMNEDYFDKDYSSITRDLADILSPTPRLMDSVEDYTPIVNDMINGYEAEVSVPGVPVKTRSRPLASSAKTCFVASEAVTWLVVYCKNKGIQHQPGSINKKVLPERQRGLKQESRSVNRQDAVELFGHLLKENQFRSVDLVPVKNFKDNGDFFRFSRHERKKSHKAAHSSSSGSARVSRNVCIMNDPRTLDEQFSLNPGSREFSKGFLCLSTKCDLFKPAGAKSQPTKSTRNPTTFNPVELSRRLLSGMILAVSNVREVAAKGMVITQENKDKVREHAYFRLACHDTKRLCNELSESDLISLESDERAVFWINVFNMLAIHASVYSNQNMRAEVLKVASYEVGEFGRCITGWDIQHKILRGGQEFSVEGLAGNVKGYLLKPAFLDRIPVKDLYSSSRLCYPWSHFLLTYGTSSGPKLHGVVTNLQQDGLVACKRFIADNMTLVFKSKKTSFFQGDVELERSASPSPARETIEELRVQVTFSSKIFKWYIKDFNNATTNQPEILFDWVKENLFPVSLRIFLTLYCEDEKVILQDSHEWNLNLDVSPAALKAGLLNDHAPPTDPFSLEPLHEENVQDLVRAKRGSLFASSRTMSKRRSLKGGGGDSKVHCQEPPAALEVMKQKLLVAHWTSETLRTIELMEHEWIKHIESHSNITWMLGLPGKNKKKLSSSTTHNVRSIIESYAKWFEDKCDIGKLDTSQSHYPGFVSALSMMNWIHLLLCKSEHVQDLALEEDIESHGTEDLGSSGADGTQVPKKKAIDTWWVLEQVELAVMGRLNSTIMDWYNAKKEYQEVDRQFNLARSQLASSLTLRLQPA